MSIQEELEELVRLNAGRVSVEELHQFMAEERIGIGKMKELFGRETVEIPEGRNTPPPKPKKYPPLAPATVEKTEMVMYSPEGKKLTPAQVRNLRVAANLEKMGEDSSLRMANKARLSRETEKKVVAARDERGVRANSRPFGGLEAAKARNNWAATIEETGFANFTGKAEGGSRPVPVPKSYSKEIFATLLEEKFKSNVDGIPNVKAFQNYLNNLKKFMGRMPTAYETFAAVKAGDGWRNVLPKKSEVKPFDASEQKMRAPMPKKPKPGSIAGAAQYTSEPRQIPAPKPPKKPGVVKPRFPDFEHLGTNANVGGTVNDLPDLPKGGKIPGYKKPGLPIPREQLPKPAGIMSKVEEVAKAVSDSADNVVKAVKNSKNVKKALTFAEEILAKRNKMK